MPFIVPPLEPNLYGRYHFGAYKFDAAMPDPAGLPGTGVVILRGAVSPNPRFQPNPTTAGLIRLFRLPAGMRPAETRWLVCQESRYLGLYDATPSLCVVFRDGTVWVKGGLSRDGAAFFDGVSFVAEGPSRGRARGTAVRPSRLVR